MAVFFPFLIFESVDLSFRCEDGGLITAFDLADRIKIVAGVDFRGYGSRMFY